MLEVRQQEVWDAYGTRLSRAPAVAVSRPLSRSTALNAGLKRGRERGEEAASQSDRERVQAQQAWKRLRLGPGRCGGVSVLTW